MNSLIMHLFSIPTSLQIYC